MVTQPLLPTVGFPEGLAFDANGNLFVADGGNSGKILEFAPGNGNPTIFASGVTSPEFLAFAPTPEPSSFFLLLTGMVGILLRMRKSRLAHVVPTVGAAAL